MWLYIQLSILQVETSIGTPQVVDKLQNQLFLAEKNLLLAEHIIAQYSLANLPTIMQV